MAMALMGNCMNTRDASSEGVLGLIFTTLIILNKSTPVSTHHLCSAEKVSFQPTKLLISPYAMTTQPRDHTDGVRTETYHI